MDPKQVVREGYDRVSYTYRSESGGAYEYDYGSWIERLCGDLGPNPDVLDLGCGCGIPVARLLASRAQVTGVDLSPVQIARAQVLVPEGRFICGDMSAARFAPESFDAVVSFFAIIHVPIEEQPPLFRRITDWLRPGGHFMGTLGSRSWTGTEEDWLGVEGATMYWSHADAATYRQWLGAAGLIVLAEDFIPEGDGGHQWFYARRIAQTSAPLSYAVLSQQEVNHGQTTTSETT